MFYIPLTLEEPTKILCLYHLRPTDIAPVWSFHRKKVLQLINNSLPNDKVPYSCHYNLIYEYRSYTAVLLISQIAIPVFRRRKLRVFLLRFDLFSLTDKPDHMATRRKNFSSPPKIRWFSGA